MFTLLYLHGFNSGPGSKKARQTREWLKKNAASINFICPQLSPYAKEALIQIEKIVNKYIDSISLLGSSMGGFLGTYLVEKYSIKGAFVNPAVNPSRGLSNYIGQNRNYLSDETWVFKKHHISEYKEVTCKKIMKHGQYLILLETGDEVLNYKDAVQYYNGASIIIVQGGEHRFVSYEKYLPKIYDFLFS